MNRILPLNILLALLCSILLAKMTADILSYRFSHAFPEPPSKASTHPSRFGEDLPSFSRHPGKRAFRQGDPREAHPVVTHTAAAHRRDHFPKGPPPPRHRSGFIPGNLRPYPEIEHQGGTSLPARRPSVRHRARWWRLKRRWRKSWRGKPG